MNVQKFSTLRSAHNYITSFPLEDFLSSVDLFVFHVICLLATLQNIAKSYERIEILWMGLEW